MYGKCGTRVGNIGGNSGNDSGGAVYRMSSRGRDGGGEVEIVKSCRRGSDNSKDLSAGLQRAPDGRPAQGDSHSIPSHL